MACQSSHCAQPRRLPTAANRDTAYGAHHVSFEISKMLDGEACGSLPDLLLVPCAPLQGGHERVTCHDMMSVLISVAG